MSNSERHKRTWQPCITCGQMGKRVPEFECERCGKTEHLACNKKFKTHNDWHMFSGNYYIEYVCGTCDPYVEPDKNEIENDDGCDDWKYSCTHCDGCTQLPCNHAAQCKSKYCTHGPQCRSICNCNK